jgi:Holliday junction resolvasome RuvABC ATP-dependent DNA helicase subunit
MAEFSQKKAVARLDEHGSDRVERIVGGAPLDDDARLDASVRPKTLAEYIGQKRVKENIAIAIEAARTRGEALDHVLLYGPPGLGKTTLAQIIANELGVVIKTSAGPLLERKGDLTAILTSLEKKEVFFLDEIHRLQPAVEEVLYPAMEDFRVDLVIGQGPGARIHPFHLSQFTLIGATTRRTDHRALALALRHRAPPRFLRAVGSADHPAPLGENPEHPDGRSRRPGNCRTLPRHAARCQPASPPRP